MKRVVRGALWCAVAMLAWGCPEDPEDDPVQDAEPRIEDMRVINVEDAEPPPPDGGEGDMAVTDGGEGVDGGTGDLGPDAAPRPECSDGLDNDGDARVDFPDDPGCEDADDPSEDDPPALPQCDDRQDNDGDGLVDLYDPDCSSEADPTEGGGNAATECANGVDDDENGFADWPNDPGCHAAGDATEGSVDVPQCFNEADDDGDGATDYPNDPGCAGRGDRDETDPEPAAACSNGVDDDGNGATDWPDDTGCEAAGDPVEQGPCGADVEVVDLNAHFAENDVYDGTTVGAPANSVGSCGGGAGGERFFFYRVERPLEVLRFSTEHPETRSPVVMYLRASCLGPADQQCDRGAVDRPGRTLTIERPEPGLYFLVIDTSARDGGGDFRLTVDAVGPPHCRDGEDNDGDGLLDVADPGCTEPDDDSEDDPPEPPVCSDGLDNDGDGAIDFPADEDCLAAGAEREEPLCPLAIDEVFQLGQDGGQIDLPILVGAQSAAQGSCEPGPSPEVLVVLTLDDPSDVTIQVLENNVPANAAIHARTECAEPGTETGCRTGAANMLPLTLGGLDRGVHYIFIEQGFLAVANPRIATISVVSNIRACNNLIDDDGDGLLDLEDPGCEEGLDNSEVDPMEVPECNDGLDNDDDGEIDWPDDDGCAAAGDMDEAPFCMAVRDVTVIPLAGGRFQTSTRGLMNNFEARCAGNARGGEQVFAITTPRAINFTAEMVQADYDTSLHMRSVCDDPAAEIACDDDGGQGLLSRINLQLQPGTYFLFVDGFGASTGTGTLQVTIQ